MSVVFLTEILPKFTGIFSLSHSTVRNVLSFIKIIYDKIF